MLIALNVIALVVPIVLLSDQVLRSVNPICFPFLLSEVLELEAWMKNWNISVREQSQLARYAPIAIR
jgi:hypothetical protein